MMDERVLKLKTPRDCEVFAKNATDRGRPDLAQEARQRSVQLKAESYGAKTEAERECLKAVNAYEEVLSAKNGKNTKASSTWQMIKKHGILPAVERAVNRPQETAGYTALLEMGLEDYAFEAVVVKYPDLFSEEAVARCTERIQGWEHA
ncbi:hypothetical protein [Methylomonas sp. TEB]|uniref:hypothetical protein n=1 Tax=Methylomonas sp. TEB TaxID=3398229 RepID=UPI0039F4F8F3